jgi:hypothetical protein
MPAEVSRDILRKVNDSHGELVAMLACDDLASMNGIPRPRRAHLQPSGQLRERRSQLPHRPKAKEAPRIDPLLPATPGQHLLPIDLVDVYEIGIRALFLIASKTGKNCFVDSRQLAITLKILLENPPVPAQSRGAHSPKLHPDFGKRLWPAAHIVAQSE